MFLPPPYHINTTDVFTSNSNNSLFPVQKGQFIPEEHLGKLFEEVQMRHVFRDSKTFVDCIPRFTSKQILQSYEQEKNQPNFDLKDFVQRNFELPPEPAKDLETNPELSVEHHIERLWSALTRQPDTEKSSLISLPYPYVVPGGRFREIYYWDSYFTMLGLQENRQIDLIQNMVDNFTYLINTVGHIPNGNRSYLVSRSQPPCYALMLNILAEEKGKDIFKIYAPALRKEYAFWMDGADTLTETKRTHRRTVRMPDGSILNRYWDDKATPRPESYREDIWLAKESGRNPEEIYRDIKAACESGWDFSSRWFADGKTIQTIHTTELIPVDLNCLLYYAEMTLAEIAEMEQNEEEEVLYQRKAEARKEALLNYCWSNNDNFFYDYDFVNCRISGIPTLAAVFPLYFGMAEHKQAEAVAAKLEADFLKPGGLATTLNHTEEQWDATNGWAPLHWISIQGVRNYGLDTLANTIASKWINLNIETYKRTGKLMEKYNVEDTRREGGGGEYEVQDGFGWTNGVLLKLLSTETK